MNKQFELVFYVKHPTKPLEVKQIDRIEANDLVELVLHFMLTIANYRKEEQRKIDDDDIPF